MNNEQNRMQEFLNSDEYKAWQKSLFDFIYLEMEDDEKEKLIIDLENKLLFASIKLNSYYSKEKCYINFPK